MYEMFGKDWFDENMDYVFAITDSGQFDMQWTILIKRKEE